MWVTDDPRDCSTGPSGAAVGDDDVGDNAEHAGAAAEGALDRVVVPVPVPRGLRVRADRPGGLLDLPEHVPDPDDRGDLVRRCGQLRAGVPGPEVLGGPRPGHALPGGPGTDHAAAGPD